MSSEEKKIPPWLMKARFEMGIHETPGKEATQRIVEYHAETSYKATSDEVPWCSSFLCAMFEWTGIPSTRSAAAKSWLSWGRVIDKPVQGCVVIFEKMGKFHVGLYEYEDPKDTYALGGNQSNKVCVMPFETKFVVGYRLPKEEYWSPKHVSDHESNSLDS